MKAFIFLQLHMQLFKALFKENPLPCCSRLLPKQPWAVGQSWCWSEKLTTMVLASVWFNPIAYIPKCCQACVPRHTHPRTHLCVSLPKLSAWSLLNPWGLPGLLRAWACRRALTEHLEISLLVLWKVTLFIKNLSLHVLHFIYFHILVHRYVGINKQTWDKLRLKKWRTNIPSLTEGRGSSMPLFEHFGEKISEETTGGGTSLGYATCGTLPGLTRTVSN